MNSKLRVGGPSSAAAGWTREFLAHLEASGSPLDFLSTHDYGNVPLDHSNRAGDTVFAAAFLLRDVASALGRVGALSHWVVSDHFEELGPPPELFHGGFGLLSVGNLRKPRYWALSLLAGMGPHKLKTSVTSDGAGGLVEAIAARHDDGCVGILVWNATQDHDQVSGDPQPDRQIRLRVHVEPGMSYAVRHYHIDAEHSNIATTWDYLRNGAAWPDDGQWRMLREMNTLDELCAPARITARTPPEVVFDLPMPGISYLELVP